MQSVGKQSVAANSVAVLRCILVYQSKRLRYKAIFQADHSCLGWLKIPRALLPSLVPSRADRLNTLVRMLCYGKL
jgi:hypothetical protein